MAEICVIIPMYNFGEYTTKCIDLTLEHAGVEIDIVVVDDCSDTPFEDSRVKIIRLDKNLGFTGATNAGIEYAWNTYKYVHLLNNDSEPKPGFIKELLPAFDMDEKIGIACSTRETMYEGKLVIINQPVDCLSGHCAWTEEDLPHDIYYAPWIALCSALIRTDVIRQVGLLDRRMKNHCSDNDFCVRAGIMGYNTVLVPTSKIFHHHQITTMSLGIEASADQVILIQKIRCDYMGSILKNFPLNANENKFYELVFREKEEVMPNAQ